MKITHFAFRDFISHYDGFLWAHNGPDMVTRVIKKHCQLQKIDVGDKFQCSNFTIFSQNKCNEIRWNEAKVFFEEKISEKTLTRIENSYFVHLFDHLTKTHQLRTNSTAALIRIAEKYCPKVLEYSGDFFWVLKIYTSHGLNFVCKYFQCDFV